MLGDLLNLLAAVLSTLAGGFAAAVVFRTGADPAAIIAAVLAVGGSLCWVAAAIAALVERRKP